MFTRFPCRRRMRAARVSALAGRSLALTRRQPACLLLQAAAAGVSGAAPENCQQLDKGVLYVVSTPIGNLEDVTLRALRVLRDCDCVLAEDTRHTRGLLTHFSISKPLVSLHEHNEASRADGVISRLAEGQALALVSDAGTPGVADPGALVIAAVLAAGHRVVAVPGASSLLAALVCSGLPTRHVTFAAFLPAAGGPRRRKLQSLAAGQRDATLALFVPPHRLAATLADAAAALGGERRCVVARELTKIHEEMWRSSLGEAASEFSQPGRARGEVVLLIEGETDAATEEASAAVGAVEVEAAADAAADVDEALRALLAQGVSPSRAAKQVAETLGVRRRDVYAQAQAIAVPQRR